MLDVDNIQVVLGGQTIVDNFNLHLTAGECVALSGASGCGKTTILRAIAGLVELQEGQIICHAKRLAYLFQEPRLLPWLRADENIRLVAPNIAQPRIHELFQMLWLDTKDTRKYPHELSGGMQQRVALARALITKPDLLLMDEPFSALDARLRAELQQCIIEVITHGTAVCLVTHDAQEAVKLAHHIYCLQGKPTQCFADIHLPDSYDKRHTDWIRHHSEHPALRGIEKAALAN